MTGFNNAMVDERKKRRTTTMLVQKSSTYIPALIGFTILALIVFFMVDVLILVFLGVLLSLVFAGIRDFVCQWTSLKNPKAALILVVLLTFVSLGMFIAMSGSQLLNQASKLDTILPEAIDNLKLELEKTELGQEIVATMPADFQLGDMVESSNDSSVVNDVTGWFSTTFGIIANVILVVFIGIYLALEPRVYSRGVLMLVPSKYRSRAKLIFDDIGTVLQRWLLGRLFSVTLVTSFTAIGLLLIDVPAAIGLGIVAGILSFIPNFGPILGAIPGVMVAFMDSPQKALMALGVYLLAQVLETYVVTPYIDRQLISLPPALVIIAQLILAAIVGVWGLMVAPAVVGIGIVLVRRLYVEDVLHEEWTIDDLEKTKTKLMIEEPA